MGVRIVKEPLVRMPGYTFLAGEVVVAGCPVMLSSAVSQGEIQVADGTDTALGFALEGTGMPTFGSPIVGQQNVTEYNRGGLISVGLGGGIYEVFRGPLDPTTVNTAGPLKTNSTAPWAVNKPIYMLQAGTTTGAGVLTTDSAGATRVGRIINATGSGESLRVQFIAEI